MILELMAWLAMEAPEFVRRSLHRASPTPAPGTVRPAMQDLTMLLFTVVFFALAFLYVKACQKLR
jgi:hypothetical protein